MQITCPLHRKSTSQASRSGERAKMLHSPRFQLDRAHRHLFAITCNFCGLQSGHRLDIFNPKVKRQARKFNACQILLEKQLSPVFFLEHLSTHEGEFARINSGMVVERGRKLGFGRVATVLVNIFSNDLQRGRLMNVPDNLFIASLYWDSEHRSISRLKQLFDLAGLTDSIKDRCFSDQ